GRKQKQRSAGKVNTRIAANDHLAIAHRIPGKSEPGSPLVAGVRDPGRIVGRTGWKYKSLNLVDERGVVSLRRRVVLLFPAKAVVQREVRTNAPRILAKECKLVPVVRRLQV